MNKVQQKLYEVERITGKKEVRGTPWYFVKWKGYPESESTWEPCSSLGKAKGAVKRYEKYIRDRQTRAEVAAAIQRHRSLSEEAIAINSGETGGAAKRSSSTSGRYESEEAAGPSGSAGIVSSGSTSSSDEHETSSEESESQVETAGNSTRKRCSSQSSGSHERKNRSPARTSKCLAEIATEFQSRSGGKRRRLTGSCVEDQVSTDSDSETDYGEPPSLEPQVPLDSPTLLLAEEEEPTLQPLTEETPETTSSSPPHKSGASSSSRESSVSPARKVSSPSVGVLDPSPTQNRAEQLKITKELAKKALGGYIQENESFLETPRPPKAGSSGSQIMSECPNKQVSSLKSILKRNTEVPGSAKGVQDKQVPVSEGNADVSKQERRLEILGEAMDNAITNENQREDSYVDVGSLDEQVLPNEPVASVRSRWIDMVVGPPKSTSTMISSVAVQTDTACFQFNEGYVGLYGTGLGHATSARRIVNIQPAPVPEDRFVYLVEYHDYSRAWIKANLTAQLYPQTLIQFLQPLVQKALGLKKGQISVEQQEETLVYY